MSLRPIDSRTLRDPEAGDTGFTRGATSMNKYEAPSAHVARRQPVDRRKRAAFLVVAIVAVAVAVAACVLIGTRFASESTSVQEGDIVDIVIPDGYGAGDISQLLQQAGVISSTNDFMVAVQSAGAESSLKAGTYHIAAGTDLTDIVSQLVAGPTDLGTSLTIPEGLTVAQTAQLVEETLGIASTDFLAQARASYYVTDYPFLADAYNDSLEGYLFPKTYNFTADVTADTVIRTMLSQYQTEISAAGIDFSTATQGGVTLSQREVVILASLIERETSVADERALIASVVYNRLNGGWYLQIDATIAYALGTTGLITQTDIDAAAESPYSTYANLGLPAGPICSPSIESIQAAAQPAETSYYYYVASSALDGTHVFCETEDQFWEAYNSYNAAMGIE